IYHPHHLERLRTIGRMQARGLQLAAIRDLLSLDAPERLSVWQWLGLHGKANAPVQDTPVEVDAAGLDDHVPPPYQHLLPELERHGLLERLPDGRFRLPLPRLLGTTVAFAEVGVQVEVTVELANIVSRHLTDAADEILRFLRSRIGDSFSSGDLDELAATLEVVDRRAPEAVGLLWAEVMRRAVHEFRTGLEDAFGTPSN